jgi:NDP-sugar pyrophosphorylase family protein
MADIPVALLAGGLATRLQPITATVPKALVEVAGRPFIDHQLALLHRHGARRVVLCLGHLGEQVERHVGDGSRLGLEVRYSYEGDRLLGTGGALRKALPLLGEVFWVLDGDSYLDFDYAEALAIFSAWAALGLMTAFRNDNRSARSNIIFRAGRPVCFNRRGYLPDMTHIEYGASLLRRLALERLPADRPSDLADLLGALAAEGRLGGYEVHERLDEIGSPAGLAQTEAHLLARAA